MQDSSYFERIYSPAKEFLRENRERILNENPGKFVAIEIKDGIAKDIDYDINYELLRCRVSHLNLVYFDCLKTPDLEDAPGKKFCVKEP